MKHLLLIFCLLCCGCNARAGWFFKDPPPPPPDLGPEYRTKIAKLEEQAQEQHQTTEHWKTAAGGLCCAALLLFVIGTALGAKTRQNYDPTRSVGRTHTPGANGARNHMGEADASNGHPTMAA